MNRYSKSSQARFDTLHPDLQRLFLAVLQIRDHAILEGHRGEHDQEVYFQSGKSELHWPHGKHNKLPSEAVDAAPVPISWKDIAGFIDFAKLVLNVATALGIPIRWGGDWDMDGDMSDEKFRDLVHFELVR